MAVLIARTVILFTVLISSMRLMGKRQLGELQLSELVVAVLVSSFASHPLQDIGMPMINGIVPIIVLLCCEIIISGVAMKSARARALMYGKPSILVADGRIDQNEMRRNRFTLDELHEELRKQAVTDIATVKYALLETNGVLSVLEHPAESPVTPSQLGIDVPDSGLPTIIINDGRILGENLSMLGLNRQWLDSELGKLSITDSRDVFIMSVNSLGEIYFAAKGEEERK